MRRPPLRHRDRNVGLAERAAEMDHQRLIAAQQPCRNLHSDLQDASRESGGLPVKQHRGIASTDGVERRLQRPPPELSPEMAARLHRPAGVPELWSDHFRLMADLQVLAFQGDLTRVSTLITGVEGSRRVFSEIGIAEEHHGISHHKNDPAKIEQITQINVLQMQNLAYFIGKLQGIPEGDGTLLDHMMLLASGGLSDGNTHRHYDLPTLLIGRANGQFRPGRHVAYDPEQKTPIANLYLNMLNAMGIEANAFGDSTKRLSEVSQPV